MGMLLQLLSAAMITTASPSGKLSGLTMTSYSNTAFFDSGKHPKPISHTISSLEGLKLPGGKAPHSVLLSGALKPAQPGKYGFQLTFEPARERHQPIAAQSPLVLTHAPRLCSALPVAARVRAAVG